jgi:hypothetical protein
MPVITSRIPSALALVAATLAAFLAAIAFLVGTGVSLAAATVYQTESLRIALGPWSVDTLPEALVALALGLGLVTQAPRALGRLATVWWSVASGLTLKAA